MSPAANEVVQPVRALILDMDGLLVDTEHLAAAALERFLERHGRRLEPGTMEQTLGRRLPEAIALVAERYALAGPLSALVDEYDNLRLEALRGKVRPMPGAPELLTWARAVGLPMALATSSRRRHADLSLGEAGLAGFYAAEVTGESVTKGKPDPEIFLTAAGRLGVAPAKCLVLEDAPAGLAAAVSGGMRCLWVPNEKTRHLLPGVAVDATVADLHEARRWIERHLGEQPGRTASPTVSDGAGS